MGQDGDAEAQGLDMEAMRRILLNYEKAHKEGFAPKNPELEGLLASLKEDDPVNENISFPGKGAKQTERIEEIVPEPIFVVKTNNEKGQKVFINICGSSKISAPGEWEEGVPAELEEAFCSANPEQDDGAQNLRFSLSCSDPMTSTDKCGRLCYIYDVVYNSAIVQQAMAHKKLKFFLVDMAMAWIEQKYSNQLKHDFKLPKLKYKGQVIAKHYIRAHKAQLVTELPDECADSQPSFPLLIAKSTLCKYKDAIADSTFSPSKCLTQAMHTMTTECAPLGATAPRYNENVDDLPEIDMPFQDSRPSSLKSDNVPTCMKWTADNTSKVISLEPSSMDCESFSLLPFPNATSEGKTSFWPATSNEDNSKLEQYISQELHRPSHKEQIIGPQYPQIEMQFVGDPVESVTVKVKFPSIIEVGNVNVLATNTDVYVEAISYELIVIPLLFPTTATEAMASLCPAQGLLYVSLPYLPYSTLFRMEVS